MSQLLGPFVCQKKSITFLIGPRQLASVWRSSGFGNNRGLASGLDQFLADEAAYKNKLPAMIIVWGQQIFNNISYHFASLINFCFCISKVILRKP